jgi:hypothetical protein
VRTSRCGAAHDHPGQAEPPQLPIGHAPLQAGQKDVLLLPGVEPQLRGHLVQQLSAARVARACLVQRGHEFAELLVTLLDVQRHLLAVTGHPADRRPQQRLLRVGMGEDQAPKTREQLVLLLTYGPGEALEKPVHLPVLASHPHQDAARPS